MKLLRHIRWYLRELTGEAAYDHYVERHRRTHPGVPVRSRREFERDRQNRQDGPPDARCC
jgi:uncharacterized short protein YbdD (DUF466 family)